MEDGSSKLKAKKFHGVNGRFRVLAVLGEEVDKKSLGTRFYVEDPRFKVPQCKRRVFGLARYDIQYLDWRARQDVLTIMLLHEKVVEVLNPLAREYKSIGMVKKELAELQKEPAQEHRGKANVTRVNMKHLLFL